MLEKLIENAVQKMHSDREDVLRKIIGEELYNRVKTNGSVPRLRVELQTDNQFTGPLWWITYNRHLLGTMSDEIKQEMKDGKLIYGFKYWINPEKITYNHKEE